MRIAALGLLLLCFAVAESGNAYPKTANIFNEIPTLEQARVLSRWDLVCLGADVQDLCPNIIDTLRSYNSEIVVLAYFPSTFIWSDWESRSPIERRFGEKLEQQDWWLRDNCGEIVGDPALLWYANLTTVCPRDQSGQRLIEWLADYLARELIGSGMWNGCLIDGLFYSGTWINTVPDYFRQEGARVDANRDGLPDDPESLTVWWREGIRQFLGRLRGRIGNSYILIGESKSLMGEYLNGGIREDFPYMHGDWTTNMFSDFGYMTMCQTWLSEPLNCSMIVSFYDDPQNTLYQPRRTPTYERHLRFTLSSALLGDGYYLMEQEQGDALWWEDYYDLDFGLPIGPARCDTMQVSDGVVYLWQRRFENVTVYCNPSSNKYVRIADTWLAPYDGLIISHKMPLNLDLNVTATGQSLTQRQRIFPYTARVINPTNEAYNFAVWSRVVANGDTISRGLKRTFLIGAHDTLCLNLGVLVKPGIPPGTYKLLVFTGSIDLEPVACDSLFFTRVIGFDTSPNRDIDSTGNQARMKIPGLPISVDRLQILIENKDRESPCYYLDIFDVNGKHIGGIEKCVEAEGISIDLRGLAGHRLSPGVYFVVARDRSERLTRKIVILRQ
ncbi:MAG: putative glycoside hydrolase [bacterium]